MTATLQPNESVHSVASPDVGERHPVPATRQRGTGASFAQYLRWTLVHPRTTLAELVTDPHGRLFAALMLGTVAVLYACVEWFLYRQHYDPVPPPFLRIPTEQYYAWATLLCVPAFVGGWLLTTAAMQLGAGVFGGRGRFEDLATAVAWGIGVATLFTLVPDLLSSALGVYATWDPTGHTWVVTSSLYLIANVVLYCSAIRAVHGLGWKPACTLGVAGVLLFHAFFLLFVR